MCSPDSRQTWASATSVTGKPVSQGFVQALADEGLGQLAALARGDQVADGGLVADAAGDVVRFAVERRRTDSLTHDA